MKFRKITILAAAVAQVAVASAAHAQAQPADEDQGGIEEIIVTAQRREETLQKAAIAVTAVTGDSLIRAGIRDSVSLGKLVPALVGQPTNGTTTFFLRGVGSNTGNSFRDNAVAFNFAGVFIGRPSAPVGTFFDLERVEVVKGPQGTLYGRNATGGAINVIPKGPRLGELGGDIEVEFGNYSSKRLTAAVNLPIGDNAAFRIATNIVDRAGYLSDGYDDDKGEAFRASLLFKPSDDWSINLIGDFFHQGGKGAGVLLLPTAKYATTPSLTRRIGASDPIAIAALRGFAATRQAPPFCGPTPFSPANSFGQLMNPPGNCALTPRGDGFQDSRFYGVGATVEGKIGSNTLTVIASYRRSDIDTLGYVTSFLSRLQDDARQKSLEVRIASDNDGALKYVLGGYLFNEDQNAENFFTFGEISTTRFNPKLGTRSRAVFGQLTYSLADTFRLVAGGRYTNEKKTLASQIAAGGRPNPVDPPIAGLPVFTGDQTFSRFTWKAGFEWDAGPASLVYGSYATGFKTGGFYVAAPPTNTFKPEKLNAFTLGAKNRFFDNKLQFNIEAFYWKYIDQQISILSGAASVPGGRFGSVAITTNAGRARMYGVDMELLFAPTSRDKLGVNLQYLNGRYSAFPSENFSNTGESVPTGCTNVRNFLANPTVVGDPSRFFVTDCSGKPTLNSPKWVFRANYEHRFDLGSDLELTVGGATGIESSRYNNPTYEEEHKAPAFMSSDLFFTLESTSQKWSLTGFINNVEDEIIIASGVNRPVLNVPFGSLRPPRTYGVRVGYKF